MGHTIHRNIVFEVSFNELHRFFNIFMFTCLSSIIFCLFAMIVQELRNKQ